MNATRQSVPNVQDQTTLSSERIVKPALEPAYFALQLNVRAALRNHTFLGRLAPTVARIAWSVHRKDVLNASQMRCIGLETIVSHAHRIV